MVAWKLFAARNVPVIVLTWALASGRGFSASAAFASADAAGASAGAAAAGVAGSCLQPAAAITASASTANAVKRNCEDMRNSDDGKRPNEQGNVENAAKPVSRSMHPGRPDPEVA